MLGIDTALGTMTAPIWVVGAAAAIFAIAILLAIRRAGAAAFFNVLFCVAIVVIAGSATWFYMDLTEKQEHTADRRLLDERSAALMARAISPGSALSCLDEVAGETVEVACERSVFATPEAVAAAVTYVTAKLALLADGSDHARRVDRTFAAELAPLRAALELDRFGFVAHVLAQRYGCTAERCDALARFRDQGHILANLRDRTFDEQVTKAAANWNAQPRVATEAAAGAAMAPTASLPQNLSPAPATVSPRYDFPSSQSIPPINIMVPEAPAPRAGATPGAPPAAAPAEGSSQTPTTPVPPRRPPQVRASPPPGVARASGPQPAAPAAPGEAHSDAALLRPPVALQPR
jgi:hypothetical protein